MNSLPRVVCVLASVAALGCSNYATPHHPYAPLLSGGGQVEATVTAGASGTTAPTFAAQVAISPVDHFVIVAGGDVDPFAYDRNTQHIAGELALGAYVIDGPELRAEVLVGAGGGYGTGQWLPDSGDDDSLLRGRYFRPFIQGTVAHVVDFFTFGGGLRLGVTFADIAVLPGPMTYYPPRGGRTSQVHIDPFITFRFRYDVFEAELTGGASLSGGDAIVGAPVNGFGGLRLRLRFQAWDPGGAPSE